MTEDRAGTDLSCMYMKGNASPILNAFLAVIERFRDSHR